MYKMGYYIRECRKQWKVSQQELAQILNVAQTLISQWELNICEPSADMLRKIFVLFEIEPSYFFGIDTEQQRQEVLKSMQLDDKIKSKLPYLKKEK